MMGGTGPGNFEAAPNATTNRIDYVSSAVELREYLTWPARWPGFSWIDRPLSRLLKVNPRMLSSRVTIERVPFEGPFWKRVEAWLWAKHSVWNGISWALIVGIGMCLLAVMISGVLDVPMLGSQTDIDSIPTVLVASAAYSGALFGFLQAVAIFAVQLRSQQDTSMLPLTPLIARRYFTFFILGSVAGVAIANLFAVFATPIFPVSRCILAALTLVNIFAVPGITLAALWFMTTVVAHAGEADMDVALPVLRATMRDQALADARKVAMLNEYGRALDDAKIEYNPFVGVARLSSSHAQRVPLGKSGVIANLDCIQLSKLPALLSQLAAPPKAAIKVAFGQELPPDASLYLTWEVNSSSGQTEKMPKLDDRNTSEIASVLQSSFIVRRRTTD